MHVVSGRTLREWNGLTDEQLVQHVLSGRTALFELLIRRHSERLYRVIRAMVADEVAAERLVQEVYVDTYANLRQCGHSTAFFIWLTRRAADHAARWRVALPQTRSGTS